MTTKEKQMRVNGDNENERRKGDDAAGEEARMLQEPGEAGGSRGSVDVWVWCGCMGLVRRAETESGVRGRWGPGVVRGAALATEAVNHLVDGIGVRAGQSDGNACSPVCS